MLLELGDGVHAVLRGQHVHAVALQQAGGDLAHGDRVVHHHDQRRPLLLAFARRHFLAQRQAFATAFLAEQRVPGADGRQQVEDHHHPANAKQGRPGNPGDPGELRTEALHHDLAGTGQRVDLHRHRMLRGAHQDHRQGQRLADQLGFLAVVQQLAEVLQFVGLPGVFEAGRIQPRLAALVVERLQFVGRNPHDALDGVQRHRVEILAG